MQMSTLRHHFTHSSQVQLAIHPQNKVISLSITSWSFYVQVSIHQSISYSVQHNLIHFIHPLGN